MRAAEVVRLPAQRGERRVFSDAPEGSGESRASSTPCTILKKKNRQIGLEVKESSRNKRA
jgi:hypothetical protein